MLTRTAPQRATAALVAGLADVPATTKAILFACLKLEGGGLIVRFPDERALRFGDRDAPMAELRIKDHAFARRAVASGDIGFAEGFIAGEWESPDLTALLTLLADNIERFQRLFEGGALGKALNWFAHRANANSKSGSRRNIMAHYDLGNDFYQAWLDRGMTYSAGRFDGAAGDLEQAQRAKYRALAEMLRLQPGEHVLEIGCGWGGFTEFAAREYGVRVTGVTISDEQYAYARARIETAGLADRVEIRRQDYRDLQGRFDKIASIEMFEAVGEQYWSVFFDKLNSLLTPTGRAALQVITIDNALFPKYRKRADFIQRYVFPGGMLPSIERFEQEAARVGLSCETPRRFGLDYALTLEEWRRRFLARWDDIRALGFDERFRQLWLFYFAYCEAGFRTGRTDVIQITLTR